MGQARQIVELGGMSALPLIATECCTAVVGAPSTTSEPGHGELAPHYSAMGRPSIDPVLMICISIVG
jgi:hypothetical protein